MPLPSSSSSTPIDVKLFDIHRGTNVYSWSFTKMDTAVLYFAFSVVVFGIYIFFAASVGLRARFFPRQVGFDDGTEGFASLEMQIRDWDGNTRVSTTLSPGLLFSDVAVAVAVVAIVLVLVSCCCVVDT